MLKRHLPLIFLAILLIAACALGLCNVGLDRLRQEYQWLSVWTAAHPYSAPLLYILIYIAATAISMPGASLLTIAGGMLFPFPYSAFYVIIGATTGATVLYASARTSLGQFLEDRAGPRLKAIQAGFRKNVVSYLLFLRLVPLFPFWTVNLAAAVFHIPLATFIWTTAAGIIPGVIAYTLAGAALLSVLDSSEPLSLSMIFTPEMKIAIAALAILSLLPLLLQRGRQ